MHAGTDMITTPANPLLTPFDRKKAAAIGLRKWVRFESNGVTSIMQVCCDMEGQQDSLTTHYGQWRPFIACCPVCSQHSMHDGIRRPSTWKALPAGSPNFCEQLEAFWQLFSSESDGGRKVAGAGTRTACKPCRIRRVSQRVLPGARYRTVAWRTDKQSQSCYTLVTLMLKAT